MRVAIPHDLGKEEATTRVRAQSDKIAGFIPGGMADVSTEWVEFDLMELNVAAMGQAVTGMIEVEDRQVVVAIKLPPMLEFIEPAVEAAVRSNGQKLLEPPQDQ